MCRMPLKRKHLEPHGGLRVFLTNVIAARTPAGKFYVHHKKCGAPGSPEHNCYLAGCAIGDVVTFHWSHAKSDIARALLREHGALSPEDPEDEKNRTGVSCYYVFSDVAILSDD